MTKAPRVWEYLDHILNAIQRIARYTNELNETAFLTSELVQDAVIRNIEIIGEASNNILRHAPEFAAKNGDIPWLVLYTRREIVLPMAMTRLTSRLCGRRSRMTCPAFMCSFLARARKSPAL